MGLFDYLTDTVGIDPGSHSLRVIHKGELIFNERSSVSFEKATYRVSGYGETVKSTANDIVVHPVNYVIADFHGFEVLLRGAMHKTLYAKTRFPRSQIQYFSLPTDATEVEKRAFRDSGEHANGKEIYMIPQDCCSAIGLNILFEVKHFILIDFSASKIEITAFADSLPISNGTLRLGTNKIKSLLNNYIRRTFRVNVSDKEVDDLLRSMKNNSTIKVQHTTIETKELQSLLDNYFSLANDQVLDTLETASTHPYIDKILNNGVYFTGGGSTIDFLREQIKIDKRIKTTVSKTPQLDNINGLKKVIADKEKFANYLMT